MGVLRDALALFCEVVVRLFIATWVTLLSPLCFLHERLTAGPRRTFKSAFITGGSSGIGAGLAAAIAKPGVRIVITGRNEHRLAGVAARCRASGAEVVTIVVDVADEEAMRQALLREDDTCPLDLVVANAGVSATSLGGDKSIESCLRPIFRANVDGCFNTILPLLSRMKERDGPSQVAIVSSLASFSPLPASLEYHASKAAVRSFGEGLRGLLHRYNVGVTILCPGWVTTRMTEGDTTSFLDGAMDVDHACGRMLDAMERNVGVFTLFPEHFAMLSIASLIGGMVPAVVREMILRLMTSSRRCDMKMGGAPSGAKKQK